MDTIGNDMIREVLSLVHKNNRGTQLREVSREWESISEDILLKDNIKPSDEKQLIKEIEEGNVNMVSWIIKRRNIVSTRVLHAAARKGDIEIFKLLGTFPVNDYTIEVVISSCNAEFIEWYIKHYNIDYIAEDDVRKAVETGNIDVVKCVLDLAKKINYTYGYKDDNDDEDRTFSNNSSIYINPIKLCDVDMCNLLYENYYMVKDNLVEFAIETRHVDTIAFVIDKREMNIDIEDLNDYNSEIMKCGIRTKNLPVLKLLVAKGFLMEPLCLVTSLASTKYDDITYWFIENKFIVSSDAIASIVERRDIDIFLHYIDVYIEDNWDTDAEILMKEVIVCKWKEALEVLIDRNYIIDDDMVESVSPFEDREIETLVIDHYHNQKYYTE